MVTKKGVRKVRKLLTRRDLASIRGVHMMTVTKWEREGMPIAHRGGKGRASMYDEVAVVEWLTAREAARNAPESADLAQARARKEHWQGLLAQQMHRIRERQLVSTVDVDKAWAAEVAAVRMIALSWPTTVSDRLYRAATVGGVEALERELNEAVRALLRELASPNRPLPSSGSKGAAA